MSDKATTLTCQFCGSELRGTCNPIDTGRCLEGTDCPAWICSECGELFEEGANFCSNCGAKVERK